RVCALALPFLAARGPGRGLRPSPPRRSSDLWQNDWRLAVGTLAPARNLFVIGRGLGLGAAQEAALKLKETCGLHAEAFSAAEVRSEEHTSELQSRAKLVCRLLLANNMSMNPQ